MKNAVITIAFLLTVFTSFAQLKISLDKKHLLTKDGKPFFWLGDTAWELFHRLNHEEADLYLEDRAKKGFTVIQAVLLAELDGLNTPDRYGNKPLIENDPTRPNEAYFKNVDYIINKAEKLGLIMALLPTWGDKWNKDTWGTGPEIFTSTNAATYGEWLGKRYKNKSLVWILGGDRKVADAEDTAIIRNMASGLRKGDGSNHLITFHPPSGRSSFDYFATDNWIDFHMSQTGHSVGSPDYKVNDRAAKLAILRPHVNGEPNYEDHPNQFNPEQKGWMDDFDTREAAYWNMLSGGTGHTYGNHNIWQMYTETRVPINNARTNWKMALNHFGAYQVGFMRRMFEKRNWQALQTDQSVIVGENQEGVKYKMAAVSADRDFLMVYIPYGKKTTINTDKINGERLHGWWFNPRDGETIDLGEFNNKKQQEFKPSSIGRGSDWVLIIDDAVKNYPNPNAS